MFSAFSPSLILILSLISPAVLIVKVLTSILLASNPLSTRYTIFSIKTLVLPVPEPANLKSGPPIYSTSFFCYLFNVSGIRMVTPYLYFNRILIE